MTKLQKNLITAFLTVLSLALSLKLDIIAGKVPQTGLLTVLAGFFSLLGNGAALIPACIVLYAFGAGFNDARLKGTGKEGLFSILLSGLAVHILKVAFERPRISHADGAVLKLLEHPSFFDLTGRFNSFPSGHSAAGFALAYVLSKRYPKFSAFFYAAALLIAASRVYLGAHYPSDTVAGALLGIGAGYLLLNKTDIRNRRMQSGLLMLVVFVSFFKSGGFLLFDIDEAVFSEASREMVETGDMITPAYDYEPRYDKPVFIYWSMSTAFRLFGVNEFSARFTSGLFGSLLVLVTFLFIRRVKGGLPAFFVSLALLLNLEYFVYTHSAVTDMTLTFFVASSIYSFYLLTVEDRKIWPLTFWAASALAVLTKGVIGLLFPVAIAFIYLAVIKDLKKIKALFKPAYIGLFLLISAPWFALEFYINGWEFFNAFIIKHHIQRYSGVISSHSGPVYYYLGVLLIGFFPWVSFLPGAVYRALRERAGRDSGIYLLCAVWFIFVLIFFSIAKTKLPNYVFPLFPAAAILSGLGVHEIVAEKTKRKGGLYLLLALSITIGAALFMVPSLHLKMPVAFTARFFHIFGGIFLVIGAFSIMALYEAFPSVIGISAMMILLVVFLRIQGLPRVNAYLQKTLYGYSVYARSLGKDGVLATYEINKPSVAFYARRKVLRAEKSTLCDIRENLKRGKELLVITSKARYDDLSEFTSLKVIASDGDFMLLGNSGNLPPFKPEEM